MTQYIVAVFDPDGRPLHSFVAEVDMTQLAGVPVGVAREAIRVVNRDIRAGRA